MADDKEKVSLAVGVASLGFAKDGTHVALMLDLPGHGEFVVLTARTMRPLDPDKLSHERKEKIVRALAAAYVSVQDEAAEVIGIPGVDLPKDAANIVRGGGRSS